MCFVEFSLSKNQNKNALDGFVFTSSRTTLRESGLYVKVKDYSLSLFGEADRKLRLNLHDIQIGRGTSTAYDHVQPLGSCLSAATNSFSWVQIRFVGAADLARLWTSVIGLLLSMVLNN